MSDSPEQVSLADFRQRAARHRPEMVLVLGSGMAPLVQRMQRFASVSYADLPSRIATTVPGHRGQMTLGRWADRSILVCEGRLHFYEGHSWDRVTSLIQLAADLGVRAAILTSAAGGVHEDLLPGRLMLVRDHLDLIGQLWWRKPPRPSPYSKRLLDIAVRVSTERLHLGMYVMCSGPQYETPAEVGAIRSWGGDAVGMSTGREAEAAAALGLECLALSCITNRAAGLGVGTLNHQEVIESAASAADRMADLIERIIRPC